MEKKYLSRITFYDKEKWGHTIQTKLLNSFEECYDQMREKINYLAMDENVVTECSIKEIWI